MHDRSKSSANIKPRPVFNEGISKRRDFSPTMVDDDDEDDNNYRRSVATAIKRQPTASSRPSFVK